MSKAKRRSDDDFKPPSLKKSKSKLEEHTSVQRIRLLDLIKSSLLNAGDEVFVKEQEGIITERGTIKVLSGSGYIEYTNPTSWTKQVTGRENGGWGQIRLKNSKQTLSSIKELYQKNNSGTEFVDDESKIYPDQLNMSTSSQQSQDSTPSDLHLPLKVRFIGDEDRVFKIMWVSSDFKEFHTEYQGHMYTNLADFVTKIFEDFQKPVDPNAPQLGHLRFDELMYEYQPGKWARLQGNLFPSDLISQNTHTTDQVPQTYQPGSTPSHILQHPLQQSMQQSLHHPLGFSNASNPLSENSLHNNRTSNANCNNNTDGNHINDHNASFEEFIDDDDDEEDEGFVVHTNSTNNTPRRTRSFNKGRSPHHNGKGRPQCYKCLVYAESDTPMRVNSFAPTSVKDILQAVFSESGLKYNNSGNEADYLRDFNIEIEDHDFGVKVAFPRNIINFPTKCKIVIRRKEPTPEMETTTATTTTETNIEKDAATEFQPMEDIKMEKDNNGVLV